MTTGGREVPNHFDAHTRARYQHGDPRGSGHAIVYHERAVGATIDPQGWHAVDGGPIQGNLAL